MKEWRVCTSYNKNSRYYTLLSIPKFNKKGIWTYKDIFFSRYGTLKNTIIALAAKSKKGLTHSELEEIIGMNPKCFMARFKEVPGLRKENYKKQIVYFSVDPDTYKSQKEKRFPPESSVPKLPPDAMTIVILVELIQNPGISIETLSSRLHDQGYKIEANTIGNLFKHYNISKKKLRRTIDNMVLNVSSPKLFSLTPIIHFKPERCTCPDCHIKLKVQKTLPDKKIATLAVGDLIAHETIYYCEKCGRIFHSRELRSLVPEKCNFGFDVIVFIGKSLFLRCRNYQEILSELKKKNITISISEIAFLAKKFIIYLALLHKLVQRKTRGYMNMNGGYILHLDGTCEGGSSHLISVLDGISEMVLCNAKLPSENSDDLIPFLEGIKKAYGVPLAVVSDMDKGIALAIKKVFKNVAAFICHYHFLAALGKDLFGYENDIIRKRLQKHGIQAVLKRRARQLEESIADTNTLVDGFVSGIESEKISLNCPLSHVPEIAAYTLIKWTLDGKNQGNGFGFPFDQPYLMFYQRLT